MTNILWLDDDLDGREDNAGILRDLGLDVIMVPSDRFAIEALERNSIDLLIQDLHRRPSNAQLSSLPPRTMPFDAHDSGWRFYADVLRPGRPELPVIIASVDGESLRARQRAEDFNLRILAKGDLRRELPSTVEQTLAAQRPIARFGPVPVIMRVDFDHVNETLLRHLAKNPLDLDMVSWQRFEELAAVLLTEMGWEVERTPLTRDGGVDLWAIKHSELGPTRFAINTKKYARTTVIGPDPVRAIHGVANLSNSSAGMIITTGTFGPAARKLQEQYRFKISLKEFNDVTDWIRKVTDATA